MRRTTLQQIKRNVAANMSPRGMARAHIALIRLYRSEHITDPVRARLRDEKIAARVQLLRLALSNRKARVSACLGGES